MATGSTESGSIPILSNLVIEDDGTSVIKMVRCAIEHDQSKYDRHRDPRHDYLSYTYKFMRINDDEVLKGVVRVSNKE